MSEDNKCEETSEEKHIKMGAYMLAIAAQLWVGWKEWNIHIKFWFLHELYLENLTKIPIAWHLEDENFTGNRKVIKNVARICGKHFADSFH